ncbi:MAG: ATP-binding cassette domain-containing protein [Candidatus Hydrothermarchaeales archaeon]
MHKILFVILLTILVSPSIVLAADYDVDASISTTSAPPGGFGTVVVTITNTGTETLDFDALLGLFEGTSYNYEGITKWREIHPGRIGVGPLTPSQSKTIKFDVLFTNLASPGTYKIRVVVSGHPVMEPGYVVFTNYFDSTITVTEPDSDDDGVPDSRDTCSNTPSGAVVDANGCAASQKDTDGDGIMDNVDQCPTQSENFNGYQDADGCPDVKPPQDSDGDGIVDDNDACPNEPETFNDYLDTDGCPDVVPTTVPPTTTPPPTTPPPTTPPPKAEEKAITSPEDIQTTVRDRISSTEKLVIDLTGLISTGKKIGADVSAAEEKILSATLILKEANNSYTLALQKSGEGDYLSAMNYGNDAYTKGASGMTMLDEAKPLLYSAIKKKLSDNVASTESTVNFGKSLMIGGTAEQRLILARNEILAVDSAFNSGNLAVAKEHILNADKLLSEARMKVYSSLGVIVFLGIVAMGLFLKLRSIPSRPKGRRVKGRETRVMETKEEPITTTAKAISVAGLSKSYKKSVILENIGFEIDQGTLCGIVGSSGGGKSTLIEGVAGRTPPDKGEIKILGIDTKKDRMKINQLIGFVPQHPELYLDQTVWQNMMNSALKWNVKDAEAKSEKILKQLGISGRKDVIAKNLSGGQLKRLSLGMELIREPPILVLDEPTTGLDPTSRDQILTALSKVVSSEKKTVVFTTHFMDEAEHCDEVIIVGNAQILAKGSPSELARKMPGRGKVVHIILEEVSEDLVSKISSLEGVRKVIREGRVLKFIMDSPKPIEISQKIEEFGGVIEEAKIAKAGMKEVFVYYTGVYPEDVE